MVKSSMAFATQASKVFLIMGCARDQKAANLHNMMSIKPSSIFGFRFATDLAMTLSFFSGNFTSVLPLTIISYFPPSPVRTIRTARCFVLTRLTEFRISIHQSAAIRARFSAFPVLYPPILTLFCLCLWWLPLLICQVLDMAGHTDSGTGVNQNSTVSTMPVSSLPISQCVRHTCIITSFNLNVHPRHQRRVV